MIYIKQNRVPIIITLLLFFWVIACGIEYKNNVGKERKKFNEKIVECRNSSESWCEYYKNTSYSTPDTLSMYFYIVAHYSISYIQWLAPLFVITSSIWLWHQKIHSGYWKNELLRSNYKKVLKYNLLSSLKSSFILPIVFLILFLFCFLVSGHFEIENPFQVLINPIFLNNIPLLMIVYFCVIFLHSIVYSCIGLVFCKKNRNVLISIISAYLVFLVISIISEIFIGGIILPLLGLSYYSSIFNLLGIWIYSDYPNYIAVLIYSLILSLISIICVIVSYRNKEEVLLEVEK